MKNRIYVFGVDFGMEMETQRRYNCVAAFVIFLIIQYLHVVQNAATTATAAAAVAMHC